MSGYEDIHKEYIAWDDVNALIDHLIPQFDHTFDALLMVTRGGIIPGGLIAEALDIEAVLTASVHFSVGVDKKLSWPTFLQFPSDMLLTGRSILIVDDVWNSGRTIVSVKARVEQAGGYPMLAVLHHKPKSSLFPNESPHYYAAITDAWIVYPWERGRRPHDISMTDR